MAKNHEKSQQKKKKRKYKNIDSLNKAKNTRVRGEFIDYDYVKELDENELEWLAKFNNEYYGAAVKKTKTGRVAPGHLHRRMDQAKEIYDNNNRRNNDVHGVSKVNVGLTELDSEINARDGWYITNEDLTEEATIANIENQERDDVLTYEEFQKLRGSLTFEMEMFYEALYFDHEPEKKKKSK